MITVMNSRKAIRMMKIQMVKKDMRNKRGQYRHIF